ncbi:MAG: CvpA family protein [Clostridia bacterium]|nr:CvpA family protein [Clostridia bacterium]
MADYIVDIVLAGIFLVNVAIYFKRGFAKTILKFVAFFLSIVLSRAVSETVANWVIEHTDFFEGKEFYIAKLIITVIVFVVLSALLNGLVVLINKIFKIPVLKQANQILGGLLGALCGGIIVIVLCFVLQITANIAKNSDIADMVEDSKIVQLVLSDEKVEEQIKSFKITEE